MATDVHAVAPRRLASKARLAENTAASSLDPAASSTQRIVESISLAIVERRLLPGTKLVEQRLADLHDVSRTVVRQALHQLSRDRLVTLSPARGARVAEPGVDEARQVFEVRRVLESALIRQVARRITPGQIVRLRQHLAEEQAVVQRRDVSGRTRLLADFHVLLARMSGNDVLAELLSDLVRRSSLIALMYQSAHSAGHSSDDHVAIVDALERHDTAGAARQMARHLVEVERHLQFDAQLPAGDARSSHPPH